MDDVVSKYQMRMTGLAEGHRAVRRRGPSPAQAGEVASEAKPMRANRQACPQFRSSQTLKAPDYYWDKSTVCPHPLRFARAHRLGPFLHVLFLILACATPLAAHDSRPILVEITETGHARYVIQLKVPASLPANIAPDLALPEDCRQQGERFNISNDTASLQRKTFECESALAGRAVQVRFPVLNPSLSMLFRMKTSAGDTYTRLLGPNETSWTVPADPSGAEVARQYASLGVRHILEGVDHLLFVMGLLLLVRNRSTLLKTITAFTVAHSLTLAIATLGYAAAPLEPLNTAIALSILFLGPEVIRYQRGETSFTIRKPWVVAFAFGLLHGFGFASGLTSVGLPQRELPLALLSFNVGVEAGQLAVVALVLLMERAFRALEIQWPRWAEALPGYVVGSLGAYWTIQRAVIMFGGKV